MTRAGQVIGIVAGEPSGDLLGAHLIHALREHLPEARFVGIAGPRMLEQGAESLFPMEKLAVRGYVEVLRHYFEIVGIRRQLVRHFLREPPALFIGIDAPDFNLELERRLKRAGTATIHYVSPSIWAWRASRIHQIKRAVSRILTVFPFEAPLYEKAGVPVSYVGHPLADMLGAYPSVQQMRAQLRLPAAAPVVALLPGSRVSELKQMADLFVATAARVAEAIPDVLFLAPMASRQTKAMFEAALYRTTAALNLNIMFGHAHEAMAAADVVLAASGTATLEAALLKRPMVITYRVPRLSAWIMKRQGHTPYVGLPNILAGEFIVPELLQDEATPDKLAAALLDLLRDKNARMRLEGRFDAMLQTLRQNTASRLVEAVLPLVGSRTS
ncbi:MAG TPA: lipid-A-disaccharide synthase [Burkholderiales bacterium]|nr:lipid-A-disaccharide synthase [Burkholderiales bacterium]